MKPLQTLAQREALRRHITPEQILLRALRVIRGNACSNNTTGLGSCFRFGRTIGAKYGAERACDACIADRALRLAASIK